MGARAGFPTVAKIPWRDGPAQCGQVGRNLQTAMSPLHRHLSSIYSRESKA
jgi:hypothetical protein